MSVAPPTQGTWRSNDYVNALRLVDGYSFYGVSGRQNIYGTWLTNTTVGYHKHARPPCSIVFRYHIPTSHFQQYNPNDSWLNTSRHCHLGFRLFFRFCPSCSQYLMRGRVTYHEVHASDSSALLHGLPTTLQILSFLPSVPYAGESFTYQSLRIWFYGYPTRTLDYSTA